MSCGADTTANDLLENLIAGKSFNIPNVELDSDRLKLPHDGNSPLYGAIRRLGNEDLTERVVGGNGAFDALAAGVAAQLKAEYSSNRITGAEYSKTFVALMESTIQAATQFVLGKDAAYWAAQKAQIEAITAVVRLDQARMELARTRYEALTAEADYALTKIKLANEDVNYCLNKYRLEYALPAEVAATNSQKEGQDIENSIKTFNLTTLLPKQAENATLDNLGKETANAAASYNLTSILPKQAEGLTLGNAGKTIENNTATFNLATMLPKQAEILESQRLNQVAETSITQFRLTDILPKEKDKLIAETSRIIVDGDIATYNLGNILPLQKDTALYQLQQMLPSQKGLIDKQTAGHEIANLTATYNKDVVLPGQVALVKEQMETQRAQTTDNRTDGLGVTGYVGKQKDLYSQQITSFKNDAQIKAGRLFADGWMTQKTMDEEALTPGAFQQGSVDTVLQGIRTQVGL